MPPSSESAADDDLSSNKPQIKLAGFAISKALNAGQDHYTNTNELFQYDLNRGWIAPEVYNFNERLGSKVDIFPLGCTFAYTLSGGKHPFGRNGQRSFRIRNRRSMLMAQQDLIEPYSEDSVAFELIKSMLEMDPSERPTVGNVLDSKFFRMFLVS